MYKNRLDKNTYETLKIKGYKWLATSSCKCGCTYAYKEKPTIHYSQYKIGYFMPQRGELPLLIISMPLESSSWEDSLEEIV
ncbi:hypothetical protein YenMTG1_005 [Yersinia phage vB_YenM_TG1]|uniref:Uncharacterized protein n=1 Tax=Yersinia phage vB_YenM_TG1 TaxID=1589265 RepID=A0A0B5A2B8_9CAUD|nr:hypothetical protein AVV33_gp005 [Yersinia phage vB_YenM_TG1]AJD81815.1 hypothetical protein YenMTG1_005 [Yersinia phage vB_YenM_TG1]